MRANVWSGRNTVQIENVPDPKILNDRDAIVRVTSAAIHPVGNTSDRNSTRSSGRSSPTRSVPTSANGTRAYCA